MPVVTLRILAAEIRLDCTENEARRLEDLAAALEARLAAGAAEGDDVKRLALVALSLLDEAQAKSAALVRAHDEIERLADLIAEAEAAPADIDRGRVGALREGAA